MPQLPHRVRIREVGPRDGFQNERDVIPTHEKIRLIDQLGRSGFKRIEVTSFARPDVVPQLADAEQVLEGVELADDVRVRVLVPDERGLERALAHRDRFQEVCVVVSASETHNRRNLNRSVAASLAALKRVLRRAREQGLRCDAVVATAFGCPYEGRVAPSRVAEIAQSLVDAGAEEVAFGDSGGMANPVQVRDRFPDWERGLPDVELTAHFHNTRGQGLANVLAALDVGVESFEASFGELGASPGPAGATGNVATEDLVSMLDEMGIETGVHLPALVVATGMVADVLGRPLGSHVSTAGPVDWNP